jgi:FAD/FMN-containing dehydrogenase
MPKDENLKTISIPNTVPGYELEEIPPSETKQAWSLHEYELLIQKIQSIVGEENISFDEDSRRFYAEDTFRSFETPMAAVSPVNISKLSELAVFCNDMDIALVPRGGGMSYTDGYLHTRKKSITVDMQKMNKVLEINETDMYVTVQCGCTWSDLNDQLKAKGLRTPYWGPLSGKKSCVGGALSQNSVFFGSGFYGTAVEQVIGMDVVLSDGTILPVGAHAKNIGLPFMKHYGPDLMGPFLADAGALAIKVNATLRLIRRPKFRSHLAYAFNSYAEMANALSQLSREGLATEAMGFDKNQQSARVSEGKSNFFKDFKTLIKVISELGVLDGLKIAIAGRRYLNNVFYGLHLSLEGHTNGDVKEKIRMAKKISLACNGNPLPASITKIVHADPFLPPDSILGPKGERWVPLHCIVPHSQAVEALNKIEEIYRKYDAVKKEHNIRNGFLLITVGNYGFLIEPVWFWPDSRLKMYDTVIRKDHLNTLSSFDSDKEGRRIVQSMRDELSQLFIDMGAVSMQLGKLYRYDKSRKPQALEVLKKFKSVLDPKGLMNPGALKL